ncbi:YadA-like family protein [Burkholderia sp. HI4860]|nr:ESPR-type extended signal peptide-containing protein [Burkholderia sp. HI4860]MCI3967989.1 YadA-like family protein [Burkholderia sp. HI4860]
MNKTYRNIWNATTRTWTAVAETAKSHSKGSSRAARQAVIAIALGGMVVGGAAAAEVCKAEDGSSGTVDSAGVCKVANSGAIGAISSVGTLAALDDALIKVGAGPDATVSGRPANIAIGAGASSTGGSANSATIAIGEGATASGNASAIAFGATTRATAQAAIAMGIRASAASSNSIVVGQDSGVDTNSTSSLALGPAAWVRGNITGTTTTTANNSIAIGSNASVTSTAAANANNSVAIGSSTRVTADGAVALGSGSIADTVNTVSVGNGTTQRRIVNVAAGLNNTDAVNYGQMNTALSTKVDDTLIKVTGAQAAYAVGGTTAAVGIGSGASAIGNTSTALGPSATSQGQSSVALGSGANANGTGAMSLGRLTSTSGNYAMALGNQSSAVAASAIALGNSATVATSATGSVAIGRQSSVGENVTDAVAIGSGSIATLNNTISVGSAGNERQITNVAAGMADTDAVNVSQMNARFVTTDAAINATKADLSTTTAQVAGLDIDMKAAQRDIDTHTNNIATINDQLAGLSDGTIGLVKQSAAGTNLTVGSDTDGAAVDFSSKTGTRKLAGITAGDVSAASNESINGSQLHGVADSVASAIGGGSTVNANGSISAPAFTVGDGSGGTKVVNSVGDVVTNLDSRTTTNEGDIKKLADDIGSGTVGLVRQANPGDDITVGADTDGNAVNFSSKTGTRKLTGITAGDVSTTSTDAVNGSQLHGVADSVASAIGGGSTVNADGSISAPSFTVGDGSGGTKIVSSVGDAVTNLDGRVTDNEGDIKKLADDIGSGTVGLVRQANPGDDITVGADTDGNAVNFSSKTGTRKLTGVTAGDVTAASTDAVNGSQLHGVADSVASAIGGGSTVNADGSISAPRFTVGDGSGGTKIVNSVGDVVTNLDGRTTTNEGDIKKLADDIGSGTVGLVRQANPGDDITVGADTDGNAVNFSSKTGTRKLTGVTAGDVSAASTDAVNGSQLHGVADSVASAIGGGSTVNADGSISAPSFTVGDGSGGTKVVNSVGDVVTNLDSRTTTNEGDIKKLADDIGSGTVGLVRQANPGDDITVGADTDGNAVNFSSKTGTRKLTGVTAGDVTAASTDAVNGSQLHGVADSVASAIGGGSTVNADGSISAPRFTVGDGSGGTKIVNSVGDVVTNLDGRVTNNEGGIKKLADQLGSGTVGLVRQDATTGMITVGAGGAGSVVNFAGSGGPRVLSGVANGVHDDDVVTVSQLRATGLIDYTGKEVGAVTYDSGLSFDSVTFAGTDGTVLKQVAAGFVGRDSMEAVNGGQLYALQEQFAKQYGDLSGRFDDLSSRVGELETNPNPGDPGTGGPGAGGPGTGDGSTVVGEGADASGKNSSAIGNGSVASGENSSAVGQGSVASGDNSSAIGQGSVASGEGSTALGQGATASGNNSIAVGQGSVATEANTVSFGDGTEAGNRRLVNIADGINASDAATKGQLDRAMESVDQRFNDTNRAINDVAKNAYAGIAAAMAMPNMTPSQPGKTVVAVGAANFKSGSAIAAGATYRSRNGNWLVNGATSITSVGDVGVRAQVGYEF